MKCVCPMGGDRTCPDDCLIAIWHGLPDDQKTKERRRPLVETLAKQGYMQEAIAMQLGVTQGTISNDFKHFNLLDVNKLKPAKTASNPKGAGRPRGRTSAPKPHNDDPKVVSLSDKGLTKDKIAEETGVSERQARHILEEEAIRKKAFEEMLGAAAAEKFSKSGELRIEDAIRIHKERLNKSFEQKVGEEVQRRIAAADDATRKQNKQLREENQRLQTVLNQRRNGHEHMLIKEATHRAIRACLHPDRILDLDLKPRYEAAFKAFSDLKVEFKPEPRKTDLPRFEELARRRWEATQMRKWKRTQNKMKREAEANETERGGTAHNGGEDHDGQI